MDVVHLEPVLIPICPSTRHRLALEKADGGFRLILDECYRLAGTIEASEISIRLAPGKPQDAHF
jgi:hypothetical protein